MKTIVMTPQPQVESLCQRAVAEYLLDSVVAVPHLPAAQRALKNNGPHITGIILDLHRFKARYRITLKMLLWKAYEVNTYMHIYYLMPTWHAKRLMKILDNIHEEDPFRYQTYIYVIASELESLEQILGNTLEVTYNQNSCKACYPPTRLSLPSTIG